jgi:hypothetical protein
MPKGSFLGAIFGNRPQYQNVTNPTAPGSAWSQLEKVYPNLSSQVNTIGGNISSELSGQLPKSVSDEIVNLGSLYGLNTGMPGSGAQSNYTAENLGLDILQLEQQGLSDYSHFAPSLQGMFTLNPEQTAQIDQAQAAPDPRAAGLEDYLSGLGGEIFGTLGKI